MPTDVYNIDEDVIYADALYSHIREESKTMFEEVIIVRRGQLRKAGKQEGWLSIIPAVMFCFSI